MKLVILNGSTCSGKSTIIKKILKQQDKYFHLSSDALKWSFSKYQSSEHYGDNQKIIFAVAQTVFQMGYNVISDSALYRELKDKLIGSAKLAGYEIVEINLEADFEVLVDRFDERVRSALANPESRISNTSKDRFKELFDIYNREKNPAAITFRTDTESVDEVFNKIIKLL